MWKGSSFDVYVACGAEEIFTESEIPFIGPTYGEVCVSQLPKDSSI